MLSSINRRYDEFECMYVHLIKYIKKKLIKLQYAFYIYVRFLNR